MVKNCYENIRMMDFGGKEPLYCYLFGVFSRNTRKGQKQFRDSVPSVIS